MKNRGIKSSLELKFRGPKSFQERQLPCPYFKKNSVCSGFENTSWSWKRFTLAPLRNWGGKKLLAGSSSKKTWKRVVTSTCVCPCIPQSCGGPPGSRNRSKFKS